MVIQRCNMPCIVGAESTNCLVFCERESGHAGDHSFEMPGRPHEAGKKVSWAYAGGPGRAFGPLELTGIRKFFADGRLPLNCIMQPGHDGAHIHTGTCDQFNAAWKISW